VHNDLVTVSLCGDVMLGRGVDQILPHPGDPTLRESLVRDARGYVELAEAVNGAIPRPVDFSWPWGAALQVLEEVAPDVRLLNLETSITRCDDFAPGKAVHYRMCPDNLPALQVARPDVCALANNHVLDFGRRGLAETLDVLSGAGLATAGAGREGEEARRPTITKVDGLARVVVFSLGMESSGVSSSWAAAPGRSGIDYVAEPSRAASAEVVRRVQQVRQTGDLVIVSVHWGSNWGLRVTSDQIRFAHHLVDGGVDVVHGHSSHHPRPVEVYRNKLILYGCGDLIDDYEGIGGYEEFRDDLRLLYLASLEAATGRLVALRMVPMQARQMRLWHASDGDAEWIRAVLDRTSRRFGARLERAPEGLVLHTP